MSMARTLDLNNLVHQPDEARNNDWERAFFHALIDAKVQVGQVEPQVGPDGWPYLYVQTGPKASEPTVRILEWLSSRGIGMVINGQKEIPDYIFTYGMIWNWKERGEFLSASPPAPTGKVELKAGDEIVAGAPTPDYMPIYVRKILHQFLRSQGVKEPKILVISQDAKHYDLCFSIESLGSPPDHEHRGIAEALAWFLPQHYSLILISEKGLPAFTALG
jgi:hypothetical protein